MKLSSELLLESYEFRRWSVLFVLRHLMFVMFLFLKNKFDLFSSCSSSWIINHRVQRECLWSEWSRPLMNSSSLWGSHIASEGGDWVSWLKSFMWRLVAWWRCLTMLPELHTSLHLMNVLMLHVQLWRQPVWNEVISVKLKKFCRWNVAAVNEKEAELVYI